MGTKAPRLAWQQASFDAVSLAFSDTPANAPVSTSHCIGVYRARLPGCQRGDEEIVSLILSEAVGRTRAVVFDHRAA